MSIVHLYVIKASYCIELCFSVNNTLCSFWGWCIIC